MSIFDRFCKNTVTMDQNESTQELILDLVLRRGCEVAFRPAPQMPGAFYIAIRHDCGGIETTCMVNEAAEIAMRCTIERAAKNLLGKDYRQTVHRKLVED